ncbi:MAG: hypothetical protein H6Q30_2624 [Bacteroidetes bacterium]|nr:hypothetical protein [Bacteroidota bacterium]
MLPKTVTCILLLVVLLVPARGTAQFESGIGASLTGASPAAYYFISKTGEITMPINLWGYVKNPGRYEVPIRRCGHRRCEDHPCHEGREHADEKSGVHRRPEPSRQN